MATNSRSMDGTPAEVAGPCIGVIVGSLRKASYSRRVAKALIDRAPENWACSIIEIDDLPLYNQDLDDRPPQPWTRFRKEVAACDALLFVTPEYNRSIPGVLKNATDIGSRPEGANVFDGLPAAIVSVTPYTGGAASANHALRQSFVYIDLAVMQQPEAYLSEADKLVDEQGKILTSKGDKSLSAFMAGFADWIARVGPGTPRPFADFLEKREAASNAYIQGDAAPLAAIATAADPATFFPPNGERVVGATAVGTAHRDGAKMFAPGSKGHFEVLASGSSGGVAWWSGVQHATAQLKGTDGAVPMKLRTTEIFRHEHDGWKLVHRHADFINDPGGKG
jgi:NAD(P)H-dependent FMN reductase/ketosteroid isomerase-like protein